MRILADKNKKPDFVFAIIVIVLSLFGIVMISSSSMVISFERFGSNYHYAGSQAISFIVGLGAMVLTYLIDYRYWKKYSFTLLIVALGLLVLVLIPGLGKNLGGAQRWINIFGFMFQPSEVIKLAIIIYLASWFERREDKISSLSTGFLPFVFLLGIIGLLIMLQPDLGTFSVILLTAVAIYFVSGANYKHILLGGGILAVVYEILIKIEPYRMNRFLVFLDPSKDTQGIAYHINQALLAIGTGGLWGLGFGQSRQKYLYLPQAHTDSIFAIIAEELGFIRSSLVLLVFLVLAIKGFKIAKNAPDNFSKFLATGITSWMVFQTIINVAAMLNLVPMTGVPLPFISSGGTSLVVLLAATGIMLNISKETSKEKHAYK